MRATGLADPVWWVSAFVVDDEIFAQPAQLAGLQPSGARNVGDRAAAALEVLAIHYRTVDTCQRQNSMGQSLSRTASPGDPGPMPKVQSRPICVAAAGRNAR